MSAGIDQELAAAFETASEFVQPQPGLAGRVRSRVRRRRRRALTATAAVSVLAVAAGTSAYLAVAHRHAVATPQRRHVTRQLLATVGQPVIALAASGSYLYATAGDAVYAYDSATGRLLRQVRLPSGADAMAVGPGGNVWVSFQADSSSGDTGVWLFSSGLRQHSAAAAAMASVVVPTGPTTAQVPTQHGVLDVQAPAPDQPGRGTARLVPGTSLGPAANTAPGAWAGLLAGRFVAQVTDGYGYHSHLVIAGQHGTTFGGSLAREVGAVTSTGSAVWAQTHTVRDNWAAPAGPLVRLDGQLQVSTPAAIAASPILARTENVWSFGATIWASSAAPGHPLVCFTGDGPVATLQVRGAIGALTATASTVYVGTVRPDDTTAPTPVTAYPVPAACR